MALRTTRRDALPQNKIMKLFLRLQYDITGSDYQQRFYINALLYKSGKQSKCLYSFLGMYLFSFDSSTGCIHYYISFSGFSTYPSAK